MWFCGKGTRGWLGDIYLYLFCHLLRFLWKKPCQVTCSLAPLSLNNGWIHFVGTAFFGGVTGDIIFIGVILMGQKRSLTCRNGGSTGLTSNLQVFVSCFFFWFPKTLPNHPPVNGHTIRKHWENQTVNCLGQKMGWFIKQNTNTT